MSCFEFHWNSHELTHRSFRLSRKGFFRRFSSDKWGFWRFKEFLGFRNLDDVIYLILFTCWFSELCDVMPAVCECNFKTKLNIASLELRQYIRLYEIVRTFMENYSTFSIFFLQHVSRWWHFLDYYFAIIW